MSSTPVFFFFRFASGSQTCRRQRPGPQHRGHGRLCSCSVPHSGAQASSRRGRVSTCIHQPRENRQVVLLQRIFLGGLHGLLQSGFILRGDDFWVDKLFEPFRGRRFLSRAQEARCGNFLSDLKRGIGCKKRPLGPLPCQTPFATLPTACITRPNATGAAAPCHPVFFCTGSQDWSD